MNSTNINKRMRELEEYCSPSNGSLSLEGLREKLAVVTTQSQSALACSHFLHELCLHSNVTQEMVQSVLQLSPYAAYFCTNRYHGREVDQDMIKDYDGTENHHGNNRPHWGQFISDRSYPIHVACANSNCPGAVVRLLTESNQSALRHLCLLEGGCHPNPECEDDAGLAIHYYLARSSNVDVSTVKCLVEAYPDCLGEMACEGPDWYHSIHVLTDNTTIGGNIGILRYLVTKNPAILELKTSDDLLPIHKALWNEHVTTEVVNFLIEAWPESVFQMDNLCHLPIHKLCTLQREEESNGIELDILKILIDANPGSVRIPAGNEEKYLVHLAAMYQSSDFLKILVDAYPESVKKRDANLKLAFHFACEHGPTESVKYLYEMYPGSINVRDYHGLGPIHLATTRVNDPMLEVLKFLLDLDPEGVSRAALPDTNGDARMWRPDDPDRKFKLSWHNLFLPLHYASENQYIVIGSMEAIRYLFDLYPEALLLKTNSARGTERPSRAFGNFALTPEGIARKSGHTLASAFLSQQTEALINRDVPFPLHSAIKDDQTLGIVKLLVTKWYNDQMSVYDTKNNSPLHYACERGRIDIVNYLLEKQPMSGLEQNSDGKFPIELLLEASTCNNRDRVEYTEAIWRLLVANPEAINVDHKKITQSEGKSLVELS